MAARMNFDAERMLGHYRTMNRIRAFEEAAERAQKDGHVKGAVHLSIGQEAIATGVCANLRRDDLITTTHRGHGHTIAKGADTTAMMAELLGRATGICQGKGGSLHIADFSIGMLGANGVVAAGLPIAVGAAHALKLRGERRVVACFFGDGATNRGPFLESLNWAKIYELPVLFVCEHNGFAATTRTEAVSAGPGPDARAESLGVPATVVDGNDVMEMDETAGRLLAAVRERRRPALSPGAHLSPQGTYRHRSRAVSSERRGRSTQAERSAQPRRGASAAERRSGCAVGGYRAGSTAGDRLGTRGRAGGALAGRRPGFHRRARRGRANMAIMSYAEAGKEALAREMREDPRVWALGEDLGRGGVFGQYKGLGEAFGPSRIVDTPISEATIMGAAVGAALMGTRPVVEMRFADFALCAIDELVNQAAKARYMFGGQGRVPLVVREPIGMWRSSAAQHSQSLEAWYAHIPGLVVVCPYTPADNYGLLRAAIRCDDPVVYMEHKDLWGMTGEVDLDAPPLPIGKARLVRQGSDVTLVAWSGILRAVEASLDLLKDGPSVEVIDLRSIYPWDCEAVLGSVRRTGRLLIVHEAVQVGGFGAEIAAAVAAEAFASLKGPVRRLAAPRVPIPYSPPLEDQCKISAARIAETVREMVEKR